MSNNVRIIISAAIMAVVVSLLFLVIPITSAFVISYVFTLIAITGIAVSLAVFGKNETTKAPQGLAFIHTSAIYAITSVIFSVIACVIPLSLTWTLVVHAMVLAVFVIRVIALAAGSEHINKVEQKANEKHEAFQKEKESYWG